MLTLNVLPLLVGVAAIVMAVIILLWGRDKSKYTFGLFATSMGAWGVLITLYLQSGNVAQADLYARGFYIAAALLVFGFVLYCLTAATTESVRKLSLYAAGLILPLAGTIAVVLMPAYISVGIGEGVRPAELHPLLYGLYGIYFIVYSALAFGILATYLRSSAPKRSRHRLHVRIVATVMTFALPMGALFNLILPYFGVYDYIMIGPLFIMPIVLVVFYAMVRHQLFDLRGAAVRSTTYILSLTTLAGIYFFLAYLASEIMLAGREHMIIDIEPLHIILALILAFIFQPIRRFFDRITNRVFYSDSYDVNEFVTRLSRLLAESTVLRSLMADASQHIADTLRASQAFFIIYKDGDRVATAGTKNHAKLTFAQTKKLDSLVEDITQPLPTKRIEDATIRRSLTQSNIYLIVPLRSGGQLLGYLLLGDAKRSAYSIRDIGTLHSVTDELAVAIHNALSLQEIKELNATLQQRIDDATTELRHSNDQLQKLDKVKDEFVSMASHQLRTPLTSVKGYLSMVLEGDAGRISKDQRALLEEAFSSSERMVHLISDFLSVSRLQTGKFMIDARETDLAKVIAQEIEGLKPIAASRTLKLEFRKPKAFPLLWVDEGKLRQVIMNFIDNAIYYSREHTTIHVRLHVEQGAVLFEVVDAGIGVPKSEQKQLFGKFFRAENARRQRPDGTGVGLFLAKKIVTAHGGTIVFHSEEGVGSTFGFRLPIKSLQSPKDQSN